MLLLIGYVRQPEQRLSKPYFLFILCALQRWTKKKKKMGEEQDWGGISLEQNLRMLKIVEQVNISPKLKRFNFSSLCLSSSFFFFNYIFERKLRHGSILVLSWKYSISPRRLFIFQLHFQQWKKHFTFLLFTLASETESHFNIWKI